MTCARANRQDQAIDERMDVRACQECESARVLDTERPTFGRCQTCVCLAGPRIECALRSAQRIWALVPKVAWTCPKDSSSADSVAESGGGGHSILVRTGRCSSLCTLLYVSQPVGSAYLTRHLHRSIVGVADKPRCWCARSDGTVCPRREVNALLLCCAKLPVCCGVHKAEQLFLHTEETRTERMMRTLYSRQICG